MRILVASFGALLALAASTGCSAQKRVASSHDVFEAMNEELSHTIAQADPFDAMSDELSRAIGTTALTSETLVSEDILAAPMPLPETRMSLSEIDRPVLKTWGVPDEAYALEAMLETRE